MKDHITKGAGAPVTLPTHNGQHYIDTTASVAYLGVDGAFVQVTDASAALNVSPETPSEELAGNTTNVNIINSDYVVCSVDGTQVTIDTTGAVASESYLAKVFFIASAQTIIQVDTPTRSIAGQGSSSSGNTITIPIGVTEIHYWIASDTLDLNVVAIAMRG